MFQYHQVESRLLELYARGELVPFTGAGLSLGGCRSWLGLIQSLETIAKGHDGKFRVGTGDDPQSLVRRADVCCKWLERLGVLAEAVSEANLLNPHANPPNVRALASIFWPLVITTNYDSFYANQYSDNYPPGARILGRSDRDCNRLLHCLESASIESVLWAIQGFLAHSGPDSFVKKFQDSINPHARLEGEIVVGHEQYVRAAHLSPSFRRTISVLFRTKSFWFIGSGLLEPYVVNLFAETLLHLGQSIQPHFTFELNPSEERADFLRDRLNIETIAIKHYDEIPLYLEKFHKAVSSLYSNLPPWRLQSRGRLSLTLRPQSLDICDIPDDQVLVISAGKGKSGFYLGGQARQVLGGHYEDYVKFLSSIPENASVSEKGTLQEASQARMGRPGVIFAAARYDDDGRNLSLVMETVTSILNFCNKRGWAVVHFGLLAAGRARRWPAVYSLLQMIKAVRAWNPEGQTELREVVIWVVDPSVLAPIMAGRIHLDTIVANQLVRFAVDIGDEAPSYCLESENTTLGALIERLRIPGVGWQFGVWPPPDSRTEDCAPVSEFANCQLKDLGVLEGSTLRFSRIS